jgi:hypothetical protein
MWSPGSDLPRGVQKAVGRLKKRIEPYKFATLCKVRAKLVENSA